MFSILLCCALLCSISYYAVLYYVLYPTMLFFFSILPCWVQVSSPLYHTVLLHGFYPTMLCSPMVLIYYHLYITIMSSFIFSFAPCCVLNCLLSYHAVLYYDLRILWCALQLWYWSYPDVLKYFLYQTLLGSTVFYIIYDVLYYVTHLTILCSTIYSTKQWFALLCYLHIMLCSIMLSMLPS